jgi:hypothetical protein
LEQQKDSKRLMLDTWIIRNLIRVPLGMSALEEGVVVADGEWSQQPEKEKKPTRGNTEPEKKKTLQAQPSKEKER